MSKSVVKPSQGKLEVNEEVNSPTVKKRYLKSLLIQVFDKMVKKVMKPDPKVMVDFEDTFNYKLHIYHTLEEIQGLIDMQGLLQNCIAIHEV